MAAAPHAATTLSHAAESGGGSAPPPPAAESAAPVGAPAAPFGYRPVRDMGRRHRLALAAAVVLLASAVVRLWSLGYPPEYMFDEVYYAKDALAIVEGRVTPKPPYRWQAGDEVSWPHPEAGKFAIAAGIVLFGDRPFGWRLPAVVAGLALLACAYPLARRFGLPPHWALVALLFAATDPLGVAQSRIATLDVFVAAWTALCLLWTLRFVQDGWQPRWLWAAGAAGGLALATKWSGALALAAALVLVGLGRLLAARAVRAGADAGADAPAWRTLLALIVLPAAIYVASYGQYFAAGHSLGDWLELQRQMLHFNLTLHASHTYASPAWTWLLDYRPVWYFFEGEADYRGVVAMGNPFLWWLAALALLATPWALWRRRAALLWPPALLVALLYLPWFAASRTSFLYYMTPVAPFLAVLVAAALATWAGSDRLERRDWLVLGLVALATAALWDPAGRLGTWLLWTAPRAVSPVLGYVAAAAAALLAGLVVGIVAAFLPVVLALPISPAHFDHITWFRSWI